MNESNFIVKDQLTYDEVLKIFVMKRNRDAKLNKSRFSFSNSSSDDEYQPRKTREIQNKPKITQKKQQTLPINGKTKVIKLTTNPTLGRQIKSGQRVHVRWSGSETTALIKGIKEFGIGDWKSIRDKYSKVFDVNNRTKMDLSRRWQTLKEMGLYRELYNHYSDKSKRRK